MTIGNMHETMKRLYLAAKDLMGLKGQSAVAHKLNQSPQTLNNWEGRGMSKAGMLIAQRVIGCSAVWLETGEGEMFDLAPPDEHQYLITEWEDLLPKERQALLEDIRQKAEHNREVRAQPVKPPPRMGGPPSAKRAPKTSLRKIK